MQAQAVSLEFYTIPEQTVPAGGTITLTAPEEIAVLEKPTCFDVLNKRSDCKVKVQAQSFVITTQVQLRRGVQFQFRLDQAMNNPLSTQPSRSFQILTSEGESQNSDILLRATAGEMSFRASPAVDFVGASTSVELEWTPAHLVPNGGIFKLRFPTWNSNEPNPALRKYFLQGKVDCTAESGLASDLKCSYQDDTLTVTQAVKTDLSPGSKVAIVVTGFKNPIDTAPVKGFTV